MISYRYLRYLLAGAAMPPAMAFAQSADQSPSPAASSASDAAEIVVTAQKRAQSLIDVPIAITAIGGDELAARGVTNNYDMVKLVPGLDVSQTGAQVFIFLRGVGGNAIYVGGENPVAEHMNGVYVASRYVQGSTLFDVERVEVVKGPQGDLYGRNATGGSINIITRKPTDTLSANGRLTIGNYGLVNVEGGVGGPIAGDKLTARIAGSIVSRNGYGRNIATGVETDDEHDQSVRLTVNFRPSEQFSFELIGDYYHADDRRGPPHSGQGRPDVILPGVALGGRTETRPWDISSEADFRNKAENWGVTGTANLVLNDALTLRSITGYRNWSNYILNQDFDGTDVYYSGGHNYEKGNQFSEEAQLLVDTGNLNAVFGLYYFNSNINGNIFVDISQALVDLYGAPPGGYFIQSGYFKTDAYAAFGSATYKFGDISVTGGVRYSSETRSADGSTVGGFPPALITGGKRTWSSVTPKISISYMPTDDINAYVTVSKGFKSGFFNVGQLAPLEPETLWAYEAGLKIRVLGRKLYLEAAAFHYDYSNQAVVKSVGPTTQTENAASSRINGAELSLRALPITGLNLSASLTYLDARYKNYFSDDPTYPELGLRDLKGNRLPGAPKWSYRFSADYRIDTGNGSALTPGVNVTGRSRTFFDPYNHSPADQRRYALVDANLTYDSGHAWKVSVWGRNLGNKAIKQIITTASGILGYPAVAYYQPPRTYGVDLTFGF